MPIGTDNCCLRHFRGKSCGIAAGKAYIYQNNMYMKKIKTFGLTTLRMEECFGYLKSVLTETANLPGQGEEGGCACRVVIYYIG